MIYPLASTRDAINQKKMAQLSQRTATEPSYLEDQNFGFGGNENKIWSGTHKQHTPKRENQAIIANNTAVNIYINSVTTPNRQSDEHLKQPTKLEGLDKKYGAMFDSRKRLLAGNMVTQAENLTEQDDIQAKDLQFKKLAK